MKAMPGSMNMALFPFYDAQFGYFSGKGQETMDFFINDLKPYIDAHFPTRPSRRWTWIGGSSCGGLMALYAAYCHSDVYSRSLVISPYILPVLSTLLADVSAAKIQLPRGCIYPGAPMRDQVCMHSSRKLPPAPPWPTFS